MHAWTFHTVQDAQAARCRLRGHYVPRSRSGGEELDRRGWRSPGVALIGRGTFWPI